MKWFCPKLWWAAAALLIVIGSFVLCKHTDENAKQDKEVAEQAKMPEILVGELCSAADSCEPAIMFSGPIKGEPMKKLLAQFDATKATWLCLNSGGGDSEVGIRTANEIRRLNIGTCVVPADTGGEQHIGTACVSACSKIWLNGKRRILASEKAEVGFHPDYVGVGKCCWLPNLIIRGEYMLQPFFEHGDEDARRELREKGAIHDAYSYYSLKTEEAKRLHLITAEDAAKRWYWKMKPAKRDPS